MYFVDFYLQDKTICRMLRLCFHLYSNGESFKSHTLQLNLCFEMSEKSRLKADTRITILKGYYSVWNCPY